MIVEIRQNKNRYEVWKDLLEGSKKYPPIMAKTKGFFDLEKAKKYAFKFSNKVQFGSLTFFKK